MARKRRPPDRDAASLVERDAITRAAFVKYRRAAEVAMRVPFSRMRRWWPGVGEAMSSDAALEIDRGLSSAAAEIGAEITSIVGSSLSAVALSIVTRESEHVADRYGDAYSGELIAAHAMFVETALSDGWISRPAGRENVALRISSLSSAVYHESAAIVGRAVANGRSASSAVDEIRAAVFAAGRARAPKRLDRSIPPVRARILSMIRREIWLARRSAHVVVGATLLSMPEELRMTLGTTFVTSARSSCSRCSDLAGDYGEVSIPIPHVGCLCDHVTRWVSPSKFARSERRLSATGEDPVLVFRSRIAWFAREGRVAMARRVTHETATISPSTTPVRPVS